MVTPLLATKLHIPPLRPDLVPRPRLAERLDEGLYRKHTLIASPAGFGKTTLLSKWLRDRLQESRGLRVAWLSLDAADNDPIRFLGYLIAALQQIDDAIGQDAALLLESPQMVKGFGGSAAEDLLAGLINDIHAAAPRMSDPAEGHRQAHSALLPDQGRRRDLVLILDDYHVVESQSIHDALTFMLEHMPARLHLIIASRTDPPLPIARLRGQGQVSEIRQHDLCFTPEEAGDFLEQAIGLKLAREALEGLLARTEGWIAGLQMAAVSMRGRPDMASFVETFAGSDRFVMDYLVEEVLSQQPASLQAFLLQTSILDRLTGPLCDTLLTESQVALVPEPPVEGQTRLADLPFAGCSGQQVLEHLERANLFLVALDDQRQWYRYHHLFADLLRQRLQQTRPDLVPRLHRRASLWYERNGPPEQAIAHALSAKDHERAASLVEQVAEVAWTRSKLATLLGWIEALPADLLHSRPMLGIYYTLALLMSGRPLASVRAQLQDQALPKGDLAFDQSGNISAGVLVCRALIAAYQGRAEESTELSHRALECLPRDSLLLRSLVVSVLALAHMYGGDIATATQALEEAAKASKEAGNIMNEVLALCHLAELSLFQGRLFEAGERYDAALALAVDGRGRRLPVAGVALIGLGKIQLERNKLSLAERSLREGIELASRWGEPGALQGYIALARVKRAVGDYPAARQLLQRAAQIAARFDAMEIDDISVAIEQAQLALAGGRVDEAARWARGRGLDLDPETPNLKASCSQDSFLDGYYREGEILVLARILLAGGQLGAPDSLVWLSALLEHSQERAEAQGHGRRTIEVLVLRALVHQALGEGTAAAQALDRALSLARPEGYVRIFADNGPPVAALLGEAFLSGTDPHYARTLLEAMDVQLDPRVQPAQLAQAALRTVDQPLIEPLSKRELEVLRFLTTSLSSTEIAGHLFVSVNTVRSHIRHIYGKLDAHSRIEAITRAQELQLI